jgi:hypothetical protein
MSKIPKINRTETLTKTELMLSYTEQITAGRRIMISPSQIERMVAAGAYGRLVGRILSNGRCRSVEARSRLAQPPAAAAAGLGLALQRLCELTYGPSAMTARLVKRLLLLQHADGLFGADAATSPAATAVAIRGLLAWRDQLEEAGHIVDPALQRAIERGLAALIAAASGNTEAVVDQTDREIILWQLGQCDAFRRALPAASIPAAPAAVPHDDLTRFATAAAA